MMLGLLFVLNVCNSDDQQTTTNKLLDGMMYRALRCLPAQTPAPPLLGPSQFARVLEAAASRAWSRHVSSQTNTHTSGAAFPSSHQAISKYIESCRARGVFKRQSKIPQQYGPDSDPAKSATPTAHEAFVNPPAPDPQVVDSLANNTDPSLARFTDPSPTLSLKPDTSFIGSLPSPVSFQIFYDNLHFASIFKPPPAVEELLGYHDSHSHLHSPETYNICIDFAISHGQYDAASRLFDSMTEREIFFDGTTSQLLVRLHARQFSEELEASDRPILRKGSTSVMKMLSVIRDDDPKMAAEEFLRRILNCLRPMFCGWGVHPKVVKAAVYSMIDRDLISAATELASTYLSSLSADIDEETKDQCLDIIHLLLMVDTKNGTPSLLANYKLLIKLLKFQPSLRPSSETLLVLLEPLKTEKKSGTVALHMMHSFQKTWGKRVVDDAVKQRIIELAEKEGRLEIVGWMKS